jgi:hypothetical protein
VRMIRTKWGLTITLAQQLYTAVCLACVLYVAEVSAALACGRARHAPNSTSTSMVAHLTAPLRLGILAVCGATRMTALKVVEVHLDLLPIDLALELARHRVSVRIAMLPPPHPLHAAAREHAGMPQAWHQSVLDLLLQRHCLCPDAIKTVDVVHHPPHWTPNCTLQPPPSRKEAHIDKVLHWVCNNAHMYSDGSTHSGGVSTAAILIRRDGYRSEVALHLRRDNRNIVYSVETVGLVVVAAHLLCTKPLRPAIASVGVDNQAALTATACHGHRKGQWAINVLHNLAKDFVRGGTKLVVR